MTHRALLTLAAELRAELGADRPVLEAAARAAFECRNLPPDEGWARSERLARSDLSSVLARDDVLGAVYQALNAAALESAYRATARERRKFAESEIPSVSGLYTPLWVAERLVRDTLLRSWRESEPKPRVRE